MHFEYIVAWLIIVAVYLMTQDAGDDDEGPGGGMMQPVYEQS